MTDLHAAAGMLRAIAIQTAQQINNIADQIDPALSPPVPSPPAPTPNPPPPPIVLYGKIIRHFWDMDTHVITPGNNDNANTIYTGAGKWGYINPQGPMGSNTLLSVRFIARPRNNFATGSFTVAPFPDGPITASVHRTVSISEIEGDFSQSIPFTRSGQNVGLAFTIGMYIPELYAYLIPGKTYFYNVINRDEKGANTYIAGASDMVITATAPL